MIVGIGKRTGQIVAMILLGLAAYAVPRWAESRSIAQAQQEETARALQAVPDQLAKLNARVQKDHALLDRQRTQLRRHQDALANQGGVLTQLIPIVQQLAGINPNGPNAGKAPDKAPEKPTK